MKVTSFSHETKDMLGKTELMEIQAEKHDRAETHVNRSHQVHMCLPSFSLPSFSPFFLLSLVIYLFPVSDAGSFFSCKRLDRTTSCGYVPEGRRGEKGKDVGDQT